MALRMPSMLRVVHAVPVDLGGRDDHDGVVEGAADDQVVHAFPGRLGEQLRVGEAFEVAGVVGAQHAGCDDQRARAGASACLVDAGDRAETAAVQCALQRPVAGVASNDGALGAERGHLSVRRTGRAAQPAAGAFAEPVDREGDRETDAERQLLRSSRARRARRSGRCSRRCRASATGAR